jgi:hypothetical protein
MSDSSKHVIAVSVPEPLHAAVKVAADLEMCSISDLVRRTMIEKVRSHGLLHRPCTRLAAASSGPASAAAEHAA